MQDFSFFDARFVQIQKQNQRLFYFLLLNDEICFQAMIFSVRKLFLLVGKYFVFPQQTYSDYNTQVQIMSTTSLNYQFRQQKYLNILCIGEMGAGKTTFLMNYTEQEADEGNYKIFPKKCNNLIVFLHELEEEEELYLHQKFDGILFFIHLVESINARTTILKWIDLYSKYTGQNIFKIPIHIICLNFEKLSSEDFILEKKNIDLELSRIVEPTQITYWKNDRDSATSLENYYSILEKNATQHTKQHCIRQSYYVKWKMEGTFGLVQQIWNTQFKPLFLRLRYRNYAFISNLSHSQQLK